MSGASSGVQRTNTIVLGDRRDGRLGLTSTGESEGSMDKEPTRSIAVPIPSQRRKDASSPTKNPRLPGGLIGSEAQI